MTCLCKMLMEVFNVELGFCGRRSEKSHFLLSVSFCQIITSPFADTMHAREGLTKSIVDMLSGISAMTFSTVSNES